MMKIAVIGATGMAGSRIAAEAMRRGHAVSGFSRSGDSGEAMPLGLALSTADATDPESMGRMAAEHDVIVLATRPTPGTEDDVSSPVTPALHAALGAGRPVCVPGRPGPPRRPARSDRLVSATPPFVPPPSPT